MRSCYFIIFDLQISFQAEMWFAIMKDLNRALNLREFKKLVRIAERIKSREAKTLNAETNENSNLNI